MRKYTESHEWVEIEGTQATVGVTDHAQNELGAIVYIELPKIGSQVKAKQEAAVLESTKAAADVYAPLSGKITAVNEKLIHETELVNKSPENDGWIFKMELSSLEEIETLFDKSEYENRLS